MSFYENRIRENVRNLINYTPADLSPRDVLIREAVYSIQVDKNKKSLEITRVTTAGHPRPIFITDNAGQSWAGLGSRPEIFEILKIAEAEILVIREERRKTSFQEAIDSITDTTLTPRPIKGPAIDMNWLANGESDPFPDYVKRAREDLCLADMSDDVLANYAFIHYYRNRDDELKAMLSGGTIPTRIAIMTGVKERLRWLSRRVAILEGRYPGLNTDGSPILREANATDVAGKGYKLTDMAGDRGVACTVLPDDIPPGEHDFHDTSMGKSSWEQLAKRQTNRQRIYMNGDMIPKSVVKSASTSPDKSVAKEIWALGSLTDDEFIMLYGLVISGQEVPDKYKDLVEKLNENDFHDENNERLNR